MVTTSESLGADDAVMSAAREIRRKKLLFRSQHRGTKEIDLLLGGFAARHLASFTETELDVYERLLEEEDADLWDWLTAKSDVPKHLQSTVLRRLQSFQLFQG